MVAGKLLHVKQVCSCSYLFIGIESHTYLSVLDFGVADEIGHGRHYLCYSCFVVSSQQGVSVCHDEIFAHVIFQFGELLYRCDDVLLSIQYDV